MLYPSDIHDKIGFDKIKALINEYCLSGLGKAFVNKLAFSSRHDEVVKWCEQTFEFYSILSSGENFPSSNFHDVTSSLEKAKVQGAFLIEEELLKIKTSLDTIIECSTFLNKRANDFPRLQQLSCLVQFNSGLAHQIGQIIDEKGVVRDSASSELKDIRNNIAAGQRKLRKTLDSIFKSCAQSGYVPEGASMTIRDGRMVIPLFAEYKRRIKGFVHSESATGQTVYIEPEEVLDGNNQIRELEYAEKREIVKLLTRLTDRVREQIPELKKAYQFLGMIDFIRAKAKLAVRLNATLPKVREKQLINWKGAYHPLLKFSHEDAGKKVVPLNILLDEKNNILLISGPNAGGKSVCLKTVGLLQFMVQCGLLVPVDADSEFGIFESIFIDIGDEQSIENDLSTYSSHLNNMKHVLKHSNESSLVLIDEFGTGTEPNFGGAIAESILESMVASKVFGVITTHYGNLKEFAERTESVQNGAMRFDIHKLEPQYMLEIGKPGSSYAIEIARKIGLPQSVIEKAKELAGQEQTDMDRLLRDLERDKSRVLKREKSLKETERNLRQQLAKYEQLSDEISSKKKDIINKAKSEAERLLSDTNREIEKTIRHIKENKAQKGETKKARERLGELKDKVKLDPEKHKLNSTEVLPGEIEVGDFVRLIGQEVIGEVASRKGKDLEVIMGGLTSKIKLNRLEKVSRQIARTTQKEWNREGSKGMDMNRKMAEFNSTLDVRGKRAEEMLPLLQNFIDESVLFGLREVKILHGKGHGILRDIIRQRLKEEPQVTQFADEHVERGGAGITVVTLA